MSRSSDDIDPTRERMRDDVEERAKRERVRADILAAIGSVGTAEQRDRFAHEIAGSLEFDPVFVALRDEVWASQQRARSFGEAAERFLAAIEGVAPEDVAGFLAHQLDDPPPAIAAPDYLDRLRLELGALARAAGELGSDVDEMRRDRRNSRARKASLHLDRMYREWCWSFGEPPVAWRNFTTGKESAFVEVAGIVLRAAGLTVPSYKTIRNYIADPDNGFGLQFD